MKKVLIKCKFTDCVEHDIDFVGNDIRTLVTGNINDCELTCKSDDDCKFWSFHYQNGDCKLKDSDSGRTAAEMVYSAAKDCDLKNKHKSNDLCNLRYLN